jgi:hypothetical protein
MAQSVEIEALALVTSGLFLFQCSVFLRKNARARRPSPGKKVATNSCSPSGIGPFKDSNMRLSARDAGL